MIMYHSRLMIEYYNNPSSPLIIQYVEQNPINPKWVEFSQMAIIGFSPRLPTAQDSWNSLRHLVSSQSFYLFLQISRLFVARGIKYVAEWIIVKILVRTSFRLSI